VHVVLILQTCINVEMVVIFRNVTPCRER